MKISQYDFANLNNEAASEFTNNVFKLIKESKTIEDIGNIADKLNIPPKNRIKDEAYPKIEFDISKTEIQNLIDNKVLDINLNFDKNISSTLEDPISKILYALSWKNGDLKKIKHILSGIMDSENDNSEKEDSLVFYQFGKYLTKKQGHPIIDQHVIRAFSLFKLDDYSKISTIRKIGIIDKKHNSIISEYKVWLNSDDLETELRASKDYTYHIDKLLFATGKSIKKTN